MIIIQFSSFIHVLDNSQTRPITVNNNNNTNNNNNNNNNNNITNNNLCNKQSSIMVIICRFYGILDLVR
jgi:hypothetical protein